MASSKRLLVTGGTGFLGRHLCAEALAKGYAISSLSLHPAQQPIPGVQYLCADLADARAVKQALDGRSHEFVINGGGYIDHQLFRNGGRSLIESHFAGALNLIDCLDRNKLIRFVQIGSSDEYGSTAAPQQEVTREEAIAPYSLAKIAVTHFLQMLWRTEQFSAVTVRLFLTYGEGQDEKRFLPQIIRGCLSNRAFPVSAGLQVRDFCHVQDIVRGIFAALETPDAAGEVINLASGIPMQIRTVIERVRTLIGSGAPEFGRVPMRAGENAALYADIAKARAILGWAPTISFDDGLARTIAYYRGGQNER